MAPRLWYWQRMHGHAEIVRLLLGGGADVDKAKIDGDCHASATWRREGHTEVVQLLVGGGADVDKARPRTTARMPPIWQRKMGHVEISPAAAGLRRRRRQAGDGHRPRGTDTPLVHLRRKKGTQLTCSGGWRGGAERGQRPRQTTAPPLCCWQRSKKDMQRLFGCCWAIGANVNGATLDGWGTPLHGAASRKIAWEQCVRCWLLAPAAAARTMDGQTALVIAHADRTRRGGGGVCARPLAPGT